MSTGLLSLQSWRTLATSHTHDRLAGDASCSSWIHSGVQYGCLAGIHQVGHSNTAGHLQTHAFLSAHTQWWQYQCHLVGQALAARRVSARPAKATQGPLGLGPTQDPSSTNMPYNAVQQHLAPLPAPKSTSTQQHAHATQHSYRHHGASQQTHNASHATHWQRAPSEFQPVRMLLVLALPAHLAGWVDDELVAQLPHVRPLENAVSGTQPNAAARHGCTLQQCT